MNEKMRILKLLEEGKITAEEAESLLRALGEGKKKDVSSDFVRNIMDGVSTIVGETIGGVFSFTNGGEKEIKMEKGDELFLKSVGSSINFSTHNSNEFSMKSGSGVIKTGKEDGKVVIKVVGGSAELICPLSIPVSVKDVGGNLEGSCPKEFSLKQAGGSAKLFFNDISNVEIDSKGSTIKLFLGDCDIAFDITAPHGNIDFNIPAEFEIKEEERAKGKLKKGKGKLVIRAAYGDVSILSKKKEEQKNT